MLKYKLKDSKIHKWNKKYLINEKAYGKMAMEPKT
jgi:hypothetical protein